MWWQFFSLIDTSWPTTNSWKIKTVMEYEHIAIECMHPLNVIHGWSLQQHTTGYHRKKLLIQSWQQVNPLKQVFWHWMSHLSESINGNDTMECYVIHNIVSVWASEPGGYRTEMTYHSGAHTELQKLPAMSQSCMWNPQSPSLPIFYQLAMQKCTASWSLCFPHLFVRQLILFALITNVIITLQCCYATLL